MMCFLFFIFFFSSRRRHTRWPRDWSSDVCSSDLHVEMLKIAEKCEVYRNDAFKAVDVLSKREARFSLILLDPPYDETLYQSLIDRLLEAELLQQDGLLYIEHRLNAAFTVAGNKMEVIFKREYTKKTSVTILKKSKQTK